MAEKKSINVGDIPFSKNIDVATNELFLRSTINRNTEKLLSNDLYLYDFILRFKENGDYTIMPWKSNMAYHVGDVVIYTEYDRDKENILNLYILQCAEDGNEQEPAKKIVDDYVADFSDSGWNNLNPFFSLFYSDDPDYCLSNYLNYVLSNRFEISHEMDLDYHRFGNLSANQISSVVLKKDMSNIGDIRDCGYWPYEIVNVSTNSYSGTMKKWGMGVIEYDLTCRLLGSQRITKINDDGDVESIDYLAANAYTPISSEWNDNYFMNRSAYSIFSKQGNPEIVDINGVYQTNLLSTMNIYHGRLDFPMPFIDTNYMIFAMAMGNGREIASPNTIAFADKTTDSIEMIYAIPNYNKRNIEEIALRHNRFQCQIIGRWK